METTLIIAQILFYLTVSAAIITIGVFCAITAYHFMHVARELRRLSLSLHHASNEAGERINEIVDRLAEFPVLSFILKKRRAHITVVKDNKPS